MPSKFLLDDDPHFESDAIPEDRFIEDDAKINDVPIEDVDVKVSEIELDKPENLVENENGETLPRSRPVRTLKKPSYLDEYVNYKCDYKCYQ